MSASQQSPVAVVRVVVLLLVVLVLLPMLPLLITRDWSWWQAWSYFSLTFVGFVASRAVVGRRHPDLLRERANVLDQPDVKGWDRWLAPAVAFGSVLPAVIAGLQRLWRPAAFGVPANLAGVGLIVAGYLLGTLAMWHNRFFSGHVRIQRDRDHQVVSSGPYRWIRHPGYTGSLLALAGQPLLLDSTWSWVGVAVVVVLTVVRTGLEDRTLRQELPGYADYAQRVRQRLIPWLW